MERRHDKSEARWLGALLGSLLGLYFGAYFVAADYVDLGSNRPIYLVQYHLGSVSLHRFASFFEPARRVDDWILRRRHGTVLVL